MKKNERIKQQKLLNMHINLFLTKFQRLTWFMSVGFDEKALFRNLYEYGPSNI